MLVDKQLAAFGTPYSAALHVIERYRLIDGATARDLQLKHESAYARSRRVSSCVQLYEWSCIEIFR